jgi:hypothetical protein
MKPFAFLYKLCGRIFISHSDPEVSQMFTKLTTFFFGLPFSVVESRFNFTSLQKKSTPNILFEAIIYLKFLNTYHKTFS